MKMKKIISLAVVTALSFGLVGCSQKFTHINKQESISSLDFTKYQKKNFLITPGEYGDNYTAMGIFTFTVYPEANFIERDNTRKIYYKWVSKDISSQEILDLAYETAIKKGADAITHFNMKVTTKMINDGIENFVIDGLEISGLLIKRER